jgi:hypothetical protein
VRLLRCLAVSHNSLSLPPRAAVWATQRVHT